MSRPVMLNLARRGFVNTRPVFRLGALLWVLASLLLVFNVWLYRSYFEGSTENARRITELDREMATTRQQLEQHRRELGSMDLEQQNETVSFLNRKIADRTFAWSRLFDRLAVLLPSEVRLVSLSPAKSARSGATAPTSRGGRNAVAEEEYRAQVPLQVIGEARNDEALTRWVDSLFDDPAFRKPNLQRETHFEGEGLRFSLSVTYLPEVAEELATGEIRIEEGGTR